MFTTHARVTNTVEMGLEVLHTQGLLLMTSTDGNIIDPQHPTEPG